MVTTLSNFNTKKLKSSDIAMKQFVQKSVLKMQKVFFANIRADGGNKCRSQ